MFGPIDRRPLSPCRRRAALRFKPLICERLEERALLASIAAYQIRLLPPDAPLETPDIFAGVFAAYLDIGYDSTKTKVQPAELQLIRIGPFASPAAGSGDFTLNFGGQTTVPIPFSLNMTTLATSIRNALAALSTIGAGNVEVAVDGSSISSARVFQVRFTGSLAGQNVPNLVVGSQNITGPTNPTVSVTYEGDLQSGSNALAFIEAFRSRTQPVYYPNGLYAADLPNLLDDVGAFATIDPTGSSPRELVRARFKATAEGTVTFTPDVVNVLKPAHSTVLFNPPSALLPDQIDPGAAKTLTIVAAIPIVATADTATVAEDSPPATINVLANDTPAGTMQIESVSQPANGTVTFTATSVAYTPAPNFVGTDTFTYTARPGGTGTPATGIVTVTVTAVNDPPQFTTGPNLSTPDDADYVIIPGWATAISAGPADEASQELLFDIVTDKPELFYVEPSLDSTGELSYLTAYNVSGIATVTLVLRDSGGTAGGGRDASASQTFTIEVTKPFRWKNSEFPVNVDGSDEENPVSAFDAVLVINYLNNIGGGEVPEAAPAGPPYLDVNGDDYVAPDDAIEVINYLNNVPILPESPSEALPAAAPLSSSTAADGKSSATERDPLFAALAADLFNPSVTRRRRLR
jgi:hypothetical protein